MKFVFKCAALPAHVTKDTLMTVSMINKRKILPVQDSCPGLGTSTHARKQVIFSASRRLARRQEIFLRIPMRSSRDDFGAAQCACLNTRTLVQNNRGARYDQEAGRTSRHATSQQCTSVELTFDATDGELCAQVRSDSSAAVQEAETDVDYRSPCTFIRSEDMRREFPAGRPIELDDANGLTSADSSTVSDLRQQSHGSCSKLSADGKIHPEACIEEIPNIPRNKPPTAELVQTKSKDSDLRRADGKDRRVRSSTDEHLHSSRDRLLPRRAALVGAAGAAGWTGLLQRCCGSCARPAQAAVAAAPAVAEWTYGDSACLAPSWGGLCSSGRRQSPIDIRMKKATTTWSGSVAADGARINTNTGASSRSFGGVLHFDYSTSAPSVLNTGHRTAQVSFRTSNNGLKVGGENFQLLQFHFHAPSEHAVDGERYAMEAHLVHQDPVTRKLAVVGVMLDASKSALPNECLAASLAYVPREHGQSVEAPILLSPSLLLPPALGSSSSRNYVHYSGSLTTPPCSEDVEWFVLDTPVKISRSQVLEFMFFAGDGHTMAFNARPLQPAGNRQITRGP